MAAQEIDERDILKGDFTIGQWLQYLKVECELDKTVQGDLSIALFLSPKFDVSDLPKRLFLPLIINEHQLRKSHQPNFLQIQQEEDFPWRCHCFLAKSFEYEGWTRENFN